jgi:two-component system, NarL family, response regulator NreC
MKIKILIVESLLMFRDGLRALLEKITNYEIVGDAESGEEAIDLAAELKPDIVITGIILPGKNGIETTRQIVKQNPDAKVIFLSSYSDEKYVMEGISAGATGYILKECEFKELVHGINAVAKGMSYLCPQVAGTFIKGFKHSKFNGNSKEGPTLTKREIEILQLIAEGYSSKEIASSLFLSERTVTSHRQNIMDKLGCHEIASLTRYAIQEGILQTIKL